MNLTNILNTLNVLIILLGTIGGLYAFARTRKNETVTIQAETITALSQQVQAIKDKLDDLEKDNTRLRQVIDTIQSALRQKGILVTIDGDMVIIEQKEHKTSVIKRPRQLPNTSTPNKSEE